MTTKPNAVDRTVVEAIENAIKHRKAFEGPDANGWVEGRWHSDCIMQLQNILPSAVRQAKAEAELQEALSSYEDASEAGHAVAVKLAEAEAELVRYKEALEFLKRQYPEFFRRVALDMSYYHERAWPFRLKILLESN